MGLFTAFYSGDKEAAAMEQAMEQSTEQVTEAKLEAEAEAQQQIDPAIEAEARRQGWKPQDEFKGDPSRWVGADEFVERGKQILPIVQSKLATMESNLATMQQQLAERDKTIDELMHFRKDIDGLRRDATTASLKEQLAAAMKEQDYETASAIMADLAKQGAEPAAKEEAKPAPEAQQQPALQPEEIQFQQQYPWYKTDQGKTLVFLGGLEIAKSKGLSGEEAVMEALSLVQPPAQKASKVGTSRTTASSKPPVAFGGLPQEAQEAAKELMPMLVGPGKRFANEAEYMAHYAKTYSKGDAA